MGFQINLDLGLVKYVITLKKGNAKNHIQRRNNRKCKTIINLF